MDQGILGSDPAALRELALDLEYGAETISTACLSISAKVNGPLQWHGADAFFFQHVWNSSHAPTLRNVAELLRERSQAIVRQGQAQDDASAR